MSAGKKKPRRRPMSRTEMALRSPIWGAMKSQPMDERGVATLVVDARMALQRITAGECRDDDPDELALAANVSMILTEPQFADRSGLEHDEGLTQATRDAQDALMHAQRRANEGKAFGFTGEELGHVRAMLDLYEQQLQQIPHREVMRAMATAADRIRQGQVIGSNWAPGAAPSERSC